MGHRWSGVVLIGCSLFAVVWTIPVRAGEQAVPAATNISTTYFSLSWDAAMNEPEANSVDTYPEKKTINPETVRQTLEEYYVPQVSEILGAGVDYVEWLTKLDDPYLSQYKVDLRVDAADERVKLQWKNRF